MVAFSTGFAVAMCATNTTNRSSIVLKTPRSAIRIFLLIFIALDLWLNNCVMSSTRENQYWFFGNKKTPNQNMKWSFLALKSKSLLIAFF